MAIQRIAFTDWTPDQPGIVENLSVASNVAPTINGYIPIATPVDLSTSASETLTNLISTSATSGSINVFAGGASKLFKLNGTTLALDDISRNNIGSVGYSVAATDRWNFTQFGNSVIGANNEDTLQVYTIGTSSRFEDLGTYVQGTYTRVSPSSTATITTSSAHGLTSGQELRVNFTSGTANSVTGVITVTGATTLTISTDATTSTSGNVNVYTSIAPKAKYVAVVRDFVVSANLDVGTNSNKLQWSDIANESYWSPGAASQSDFQIIPDGGSIMGLTGGEIGLILMERAIVRMSYIGSPLIFQFDTIARGVGCLEGNSITKYSNMTYFLGEEGFYSCDGTSVTPIGNEKIDRWFFDNLDMSLLYTISATTDPSKKLVIWDFPTASGRAFLIYNWQVGKWSSGTTSVTKIGVAAASVAKTLESLDADYARSFTATFATSVMTVTAVGSGAYPYARVYAEISATGVTAGTRITAQTASSETTIASPTATRVINTPTITVSSASGIAAGQFVSGTGIPSSTYVMSVVGTTVTLSNNASSSGSSTATFSNGGGRGTYSLSTTPGTLTSRTVTSNGNIDALTTSLDSSIYTGSSERVFAGISTDKIVLFTGANASAEIVTGDVGSEYTSTVLLARPLVDNGSANVAIASRTLLNQDIDFGSYVAASSENRVSLRSNGKYHRLSVVPTGATWSNVMAIELDIVQQGTR
jgi:hypothetical protein